MTLKLLLGQESGTLRKSDDNEEVEGRRLEIEAVINRD